MKEAIDAIQGAFAERLRNRFLGSVAVSWLAINWRAWSIWLLSDANIEERLTAVSAELSVSRSIVYPLISAVVFIIVSPWLNYAVEWIQRNMLLLPLLAS